MQETQVWSLGWEDSLEKGKATYSSIWPGEFHGLYSPWGHKESDMTEWLSYYCACITQIPINPFMEQNYHPRKFPHISCHSILIPSPRGTAVLISQGGMLLWKVSVRKRKWDLTMYLRISVACFFLVMSDIPFTNVPHLVSLSYSTTAGLCSFWLFWIKPPWRFWHHLLYGPCVSFPF